MIIWHLNKDSCRKFYLFFLTIFTVGSLTVLYHTSRSSHRLPDDKPGQFILNSNFEVNDSMDDFEDKQEPVVMFGPLEDREVRLDQDMFFFVSSGVSDLDAGQTCVVESAAKLHPYKRVFIIFITKQEVKPLESKTLSILISYGNVFLRSIKLKTFFTNPGAKDWLMNSKFQDSDFYSKFLTDALTYSFLEKFGGVVLDFDTLLLQTITSKAESLFSRCAQDTLESQPMALPAHHPLLYELLARLPNSFNHNVANSIGRDHLTETVARLCKVENVRELELKECKKSARKLAVVEDFCPIKRFKYWQMFDPNYTKLVMKKIREEHKSYGLKLWSSDHHGSWGSLNHQTPFYTLANELCPLTTETIVGAENHF